MASLSHTSFFLHFFFLPTAITVVLYEPQMLLALLWQALCEFFISLENCFCLSGQVSVDGMNTLWRKYLYALGINELFQMIQRSEPCWTEDQQMLPSISSRDFSAVFIIIFCSPLPILSAVCLLLYTPADRCILFISHTLKALGTAFWRYLYSSGTQLLGK